MYRALELLTWFDWLSPLITILRNVVNHPTHSFFIPYNRGWSGNDIKRLFKSNGIKSWGHLAIHGTFMFTVRRRHAGLAQLILDQAGVPIRYGRVRSLNVRRRRYKAPEPAPDLLARLQRWLDDLSDKLGL